MTTKNKHETVNVGDYQPTGKCTCGAALDAVARAWFSKNFSDVVNRAADRRGTNTENILVLVAFSNMQTQTRLGTLCGSEEGARANELVERATRAVMAERAREAN